MSLTNPFLALADTVRHETGIIIGPDKHYLFESRLKPIAVRHGLAGSIELASSLLRQCNRALLDEVLDAMTTNESFFFRDGRPFEFFEKIALPEIVQKNGGRKDIRIWCAACSTGQEPYTLAMIFERSGLEAEGWSIDVLGTDISRKALDRAEKAIYNDFEVNRGLTGEDRGQYFEQVETGWQVRQEVRRHVRFERFNLMEKPIGFGRFDAVFCRNVLIYFDTETKRCVLEAISEALAPGDCLFLGAAETVHALSEAFVPEPDRTAIFRRA